MPLVIQATPVGAECQAMNRPDSLMLRPARLQDARAMAQMSRDLIEAGLTWRYTPARVAALIRDAETMALLAPH